MFEELVAKYRISENDIKRIYSKYWGFIKEKMEELPLNEALDEQFFKSNKTSVNLPALGKLYCSWDTYTKINNKKKYVENLRNKTTS